MSRTGKLRRISDDRWSIELDEPNAPKIGEVLKRTDGLRILFLEDRTGTVPLWTVIPGPHTDMAAVTREIAERLRWSARVGRH